MKADVYITSNRFFSMQLTPETLEEASQLVRIGMNESRRTVVIQARATPSGFVLDIDGDFKPHTGETIPKK